MGEKYIKIIGIAIGEVKVKRRHNILCIMLVKSRLLALEK